jgi:hypothetical protein
MSLHVHEMAIAAERNLLPVQAARGWQIAEAMETRKRQTLLARQRSSRLSLPTACRLSQSVQGMTALLRQASTTPA